MNLEGLWQANKKRFLFVLLLAAVAMLIDTGSQYFLTPAYNYLKKMNFMSFLFFIIIALSCDLVRVFLFSISDYQYTKQIQGYIHEIRKQITQNIYQKGNHKVATVQNDLNENLNQLNQRYALQLKQLYQFILGILFSIAVLFTFDWRLVILTLGLTVVSLIIPKIFKQAISNATFNVTKKNEKLLDTIEKWTRGLDELRRYASLAIFHRSFDKATLDLKNAKLKDDRIGNLADAVNSVVNVISQTLILLLSIYLYVKGQIVFGAIITTANFAGTIMNGMQYVVNAQNQINSSKKLREEMLKLVKQNDETKSTNSNDAFDTLAVNNLAISFPNGESIAYPNFVVKKGEKVLLTGDSGTGKSTLFKLILGQLKPSKGEITFKNNQKVVEPDLGKIGYIAQDNTLFPDTIENNITMFNSKLNPNVEKEIKDVDLEKDIAKFPAGVNTMVDLDQDNLSGGQKQKVVLARARVHNSQLLLIDEGTSAIDSQATEEILKKLLQSDQTIIMIAHNFSQKLINLFDRQIKLGKSEVNGNEL